MSDTTTALPGLPSDDDLVQSYNEVPYTSFPDPARHPDRLATIGTLLGLAVAPIASCRVLEFACGDGTNLVPVAATLPRAGFVGFDFASHPVARARRMAEDLGVRNVRVLELDLRELPEDLGKFDYIIAHGLYSWVPSDVRACVMPLIARHLAPDGVAFVSFNALPGCHVRAVVWDMLRHHTRAMPDKRAKLAAARALLDLVATPVVGENATQQALRGEVRNAAGGSDASLAHDDLSDANHAFYFHEFVADAARAGLTYLAENHLGSMMGGGIAPRVRQALGKLDRLEREQYLDFIQFRHFREALLCHTGATSNFVVQPGRVSALHALPSLQVRRAVASRPRAGEWNTDANAVVDLLLSRWPCSVPVAEIDASRARSPSRAGSRNRSTESVIVELYVTGAIELRTEPPSVATVAGERPHAFGPARWINRERDIIPSLYHEALRFQDPVARRLLGLLDGTRTRAAVAAEMAEVFAGDAGARRLDDALQTLAAKALLVA